MKNMTTIEKGMLVVSAISLIVLIGYFSSFDPIDVVPAEKGGYDVNGLDMDEQAATKKQGNFPTKAEWIAQGRPSKVMPYEQFEVPRNRTLEEELAAFERNPCADSSLTLVKMPFFGWELHGSDGRGEAAKRYMTKEALDFADKLRYHGPSETPDVPHIPVTFIMRRATDCR